jgi:hypothetical protein
MRGEPVAKLHHYRVKVNTGDETLVVNVQPSSGTNKREQKIAAMIAKLRTLDVMAALSEDDLRAIAIAGVIAK